MVEVEYMNVTISLSDLINISWCLMFVADYRYFSIQPATQANSAFHPSGVGK